MLTTEQKVALSKLSKATLVNFVAEVQGVDKMLDKKIERLLLQSDTPKLIKKLTSNLKGLRRRHAFVEFWKISEFVTEIQYLADDIMLLYPEQLETCLNLLELFLESSNTSLERCEDSSEVQKVYNSAAISWLTVASACYEEEKRNLPLDEQDILSQAWQQKLKKLIDDNDFNYSYRGIYTTKETLIVGCKQLLSDSEIKGLIEDYKQYYEGLFAEDSLKTGNAQSAKLSYDYNRVNHQEKSKTEVTLIGLARALGDVVLFEQVYLRIYPKDDMTTQQLSELLQFMLDHKAYELAKSYLNNQWHNKNKQDKLRRLDWLSEIYRLQDDAKAQMLTLNEAFELHSSPERLKAIMAIASPAEQSQLRKLAYKLAEQQKSIVVAILLLLEINETVLANQVAVARYLEFNDIHYETLTRLLKDLPEDTELIKVIIYRSLISDILDNGRSKAYGYAARYCKKLIALDGTVSVTAESYSTLMTHQAYIKALYEKHGKKYSFWERVED